jgi:hypothetical protein
VATAGRGEALAMMRGSGRVAGRSIEAVLSVHGSRLPAPLIVPGAVVEVQERVDASGTVVVELDADAAVEQITRMIAEYELDSVAIALLWSFANPAHEQALARAIPGGVRVPLVGGISAARRVRAHGGHRAERLCRSRLVAVPATAGEGTQNLLCAYLAIVVFAGLAANTLLGAWWVDGVVALGIAGCHQPSPAFSARPASTATARIPSIIVTLPSDLSTRLSRARPVLALPDASANMAAAVTAVQAIPGTECRG